MRKPSGAFEARNLFRNVYFWMAVGASVLLLYVGFIAFTFLPRSTSEVTSEEYPEKNAIEEEPVDNEVPKKKKKSVKGTGALAKADVELITRGGWVDSDDHKMTIVIRVFNLEPNVVDEIIKSGNVQIEIDGASATIINSEPFQKNGFLTRAEAVISDEKFENFKAGKTQSVEIATIVNNGDDRSLIDVINKRFKSKKKVEVEGTKIDWNTK